ncbi:hypothetical protein AVEN_261389-1 [Araneus ventricosus]|uniref:Uncharacterized protein n=1 Tax=Araneus ventricosus TaxID=182803 RepID=A0A4Y2PHI3_ARAVE|nr:hypothetical protein AVEN_261389-1 [Araneus ventricosus]
MLQGVRTTETFLISLSMKEMSVQKHVQKVEEERFKERRKRFECIKGVLTKKLKFDSFKKLKLLTLMASVLSSKEIITQCPACDEIYVDPPSEN